MKFIDEYDGVLRLQQLLHDGFQALFKLATVLGAGHDERQVKGKDALICQERRDFAIGDALRQSFDDGSLTYARLADQYWVVLGAAAENMNHTLQLAFTSHQRIELGIRRGLGSGRGKTHSAGRIRADAGVELFPGWYGPVPRAWSKGVSRVRAGSRRRSTSLHAAVPTKDARFQRACAKGAQPPRQREPEPDCTRCSTGDRPRSRASPGSWCVP